MLFRSLLLQTGAEVNAVDNNGETALMRAARYGNIDSIRALLAAGAEVNAINHAGETALIKATDSVTRPPYWRFVDPDSVATLLQAGADANAVDSKGRTARILAENAAFHSRMVGAEENPAAEWASLLRDRENPQTRQQHWRRTAMFWGDLLADIFGPPLCGVPFWLTMAGLGVLLWAILSIDLQGKARRRVFWPLMFGIALTLIYIALRSTWLDDDNDGIISIQILFFFLTAPFLAIVDAIILIVWLRRRRQSKSALPPANPPQPTDT